MSSPTAFAVITGSSHQTHGLYGRSIAASSMRRFAAAVLAIRPSYRFLIALRLGNRGQRHWGPSDFRRLHQDFLAYFQSLTNGPQTHHHFLKRRLQGFSSSGVQLFSMCDGPAASVFEHFNHLVRPLDTSISVSHVTPSRLILQQRSHVKPSLR